MPTRDGVYHPSGLPAAPVAIDAAHMPAAAGAEPGLRDFDPADKPPCDTPVPPEPVTTMVEMSDCGGQPCPTDTPEIWDAPVKKSLAPSPAPTLDNYVSTAEEFAATWESAPTVNPTAAPSSSPTAAPSATPTFPPCEGDDCEAARAFAEVWETMPTPHPSAAPTVFLNTTEPTHAPSPVPTAVPTPVHYHDGKTTAR